MTMHELDALLQQHFPSAPPHAQQGRAGVTFHVERNDRYDNLQSESMLRTAAPPEAFFWRYEHIRVCPVCCKEFDRNGSRRKHCSDACKQKAYRQRKRAKRTSA